MPKSNRVTVVIKRKRLQPEVRTVVNELQTYQNIVDGYIEAVGLPVEDLSFYCNEEGKFTQEPHFTIPGDTVHGDVVFTRTNPRNGETISLKDSDIDYIFNLFGVTKFDYRILQVKQEFHRNYAFMGIKERDILHGPKAKFDLSMYKEVYKGSIGGYAPGQACESLYRIFNLHCPDDYQGYSMSVGHIIEIADRYYLCDSVGFTRIDYLVTGEVTA